MSLKIEQRLDNNFFTRLHPRIYTTGAYLVPMEVTQQGKKRFVWIADEFNDDTFDENGNICSINVYAEKEENLFNEDQSK
jgi:hypothetical protein